MGTAFEMCQSINNGRQSEVTTKDDLNYETHGFGGYLSSRDSNNSVK